MKIGYLLQAGVPDIRKPPFSGPANHVRMVCQEFRMMGHQVRVIAYLDGQIWKSDDLERFEPVCVSVLDEGPVKLFERGIRRVQHDLKLPYISLFDSLRFAWICRQELDGFDVLFERMGWFGFGGRLAARWLKIPRVLEINGDLLNERRLLGISLSSFQHQVARQVVRAGVRGAGGFVATGEGWRSRFAEQWRIAPGRIAVIENGSELVDLLAREQLRSFQADSAREGTEIVFIGSFDPWQGIEILIQAFAQAVEQAKALHLTIIGDGASYKELVRLVEETHLETCVTFLGWQPVGAIAARLAAADIGISPYCGRAEFSGLKLLDYKAAGLAIIAAGQDGQPKVVQHGKTGWIVPPCDARALSEAIVRLSSDESLRRQLGRAARIEAEQFHGWQHTAQNLLAEFSKVTHGAYRN